MFVRGDSDGMGETKRWEWKERLAYGEEGLHLAEVIAELGEAFGG